MKFHKKSVQWEQSCSTRTDRRTHMTKLIVAFCNFEKALKKSQGIRTKCGLQMLRCLWNSAFQNTYFFHKNTFLPYALICNLWLKKKIQYDRKQCSRVQTINLMLKYKCISHNPAYCVLNVSTNKIIWLQKWMMFPHILTILINTKAIFYIK